jgi:hypothetical protein
MSMILWWLMSTAPSYNFDELYRAIRTRKIAPKEAKRHFAVIIESCHRQYGGIRFVQAPIPVFPLKGYSYKTSYDVTQNDFSDSAANFFEPMATTHPAIDLTIADKNNDGLDDKTKKPVEVLSISEGVVLAVHKTAGSKAVKQGVNYIWIYDFYNRQLWYYGFCNKVNLLPGDRVSPGTPMGVVGLSGNLRCKKNKSTRLHLMVFNLDEDNMPKVVSPNTVLNKIQ